jgi:hypothetical protein
MTLRRNALAFAILAMTPFAAAADEPGASNGPRVMKRTTIVRHVAQSPLLVPDCRETYWSTLLKCAPRTYVRGTDLATLNQLNALPTRVMRPYPSLFSW